MFSRCTDILRMPWRAWTLVMLWVAICQPQTRAAGAAFVLGPGGAVSVDAACRDQIRHEVDSFVGVLGRMAGRTVEMTGDQGMAEIVIGLAKNFPSEAKDESLTSTQITARENYLLRSRPGRLFILGNTAAGITHGLWDVLHRVGYRQYFPGKAWEVIPARSEIKLEVDEVQSPAFHARRIWYGYGPLAENRADYERWCVRNRATAGIDLRTGHAYEGILARYKEVFREHPEYLALVDGKRQPPKFCTSNVELRRLVVQEALRQLAEDPDLDSVSCDPSDGGGWCECEMCAELGSASDRALLLTNEVARAVAAKHAGKLVGMYAYNEHSPPPAIDAEPNVVISVAAGFIKGGYTLDQLLEGWSRRARTLGIREYYSVHPWDRDLPAAARGADLKYLGETIPHFAAQRARFMSAESSDNWGCNGLGYYFAARLLWDPAEVAGKDALVKEFIGNCFGEARAPMQQFYDLLNGKGKQQLSDDLVGRMYRLLKEARDLTRDENVGERLNDLVLYTRHVELWLDYSAAQGAERQKAFEALLRHGWRMRRTMMIHTQALWRDVVNRDKAVKLDEAWKSDVPFEAAELAGMVTRGIETRRLLDFETVAFSDRLVPATRLGLPEVREGTAGLYGRGVCDYFTWVEEPPAVLRLKAKAGVIYRNQGAAKVALYPAEEAEMKSVAQVEVAPDKKDHEVELMTKFRGLHRIEVSDGRAGTTVSWPPGMPMTIVSSQEKPASLNGRWTLYFYVPKGTRKVGGFANGAGWLVNGSGERVHEFGAKPGYFSVDVTAKEDGRLWKFEHSSGTRTLMTVPACLARNARELLLPAEVVERDAR
ncbi:MAG TPA: DUF4838 domain-containing protein [Prosthecobacter sp.]|nr:DUF4838 domain-containing protein [Prosthecobacter sp.]